MMNSTGVATACAGGSVRSPLGDGSFQTESEDVGTRLTSVSESCKGASMREREGCGMQQGVPMESVGDRGVTIE